MFYFYGVQCVQSIFQGECQLKAMISCYSILHFIRSFSPTFGHIYRRKLNDKLRFCAASETRYMLSTEEVARENPTQILFLKVLTVSKISKNSQQKIICTEVYLHAAGYNLKTIICKKTLSIQVRYIRKKPLWFKSRYSSKSSQE